MREAIGLLPIAIGLVAFATAFVPRWRRSIRWRGTPVPAGVVSSMGFGMAFTGVGLFALTRGVIVEDARVGFAIAALAGLPMVVVGQWLDFRRG
jgi:hypothetical protein